MKVQVNPPRRRLRNVVLLQFSFTPSTEETIVSSVLESTTVTTNLNTHDESHHLKQDNNQEVKSTVTEFNARCPPVVPLQVLLQHNISACSNSTSRTLTAPSSPLDFLLVSSRHTTFSDFATTTTTYGPYVNTLQVLLWSTDLDDFNFTRLAVKTIR